MQETRKKFGCPKCQSTIKVPPKFFGKRIKCPKCSSVFRAGPKQPEPEIVAELDDEFAPPAPLPVAAFIDPMTNYQNAAPDPGLQHPPLAPMGAPQALPSSRPATPYRSTLPKKKRKQNREMTDSDKNLQSSGIFLLVLPVIATVLPLLGLQLRRLAKLGEFAPLAAMVLGLIGVGMICYARRNQGDAPLFGSIAAAFVLVSGIGGFFMVSMLTGSESNSDRYSDRSGNRSNSSMDETMAKAREHVDETMDRLRRDSERQRVLMADESQEMQRMQNEANQMMHQAHQEHQQAIERMRSSSNFPNPPNVSAPGIPDLPSPGFGSGRPSGRGFGRRRN